MKTIGIIGGLTWHSTATYYKRINQLVNETAGSTHSAKVILHSLDFKELKELQDEDRWPEIASLLTDISVNLMNSGAQCIILASNTPHMVADVIQQHVSIPLLHIADATARAIKSQNIKKVGLMGTKYTMERDFFRMRLSDEDIEVFVPELMSREYIHQSIFNEFSRGIFNEGTRKAYLEIMDGLLQQGAEGIVFGCTEIAILIDPTTCSVPVYDTAELHVRAAVDFSLK